MPITPEFLKSVEETIKVAHNDGARSDTVCYGAGILNAMIATALMGEREVFGPIEGPRYLAWSHGGRLTTFSAVTPSPAPPTPYTLRRRITYILTGGQLGIEPGYVVLGLEQADAEAAE